MARYSRKDYQLTAAIIQGHKLVRDGQDTATRFQTLHEMANAFAEEYRRDNPDFDTRRFLEACGITNPAEAAKVIETRV